MCPWVTRTTKERPMDPRIGSTHFHKLFHVCLTWPFIRVFSRDISRDSIYTSKQFVTFPVSEGEDRSHLGTKSWGTSRDDEVRKKVWDSFLITKSVLQNSTKGILEEERRERRMLVLNSKSCMNWGKRKSFQVKWSKDPNQVSDICFSCSLRFLRSISFLSLTHVQNHLLDRFLVVKELRGGQNEMNSWRKQEIACFLFFFLVELVWKWL